MLRCSFNIDDGHTTIVPQVSVFKDMATAKCAAVKMAGQMICDTAEGFWNQPEWAMRVTDQDGLTLFQLNFMGIEAAAGRSPKVREK